MIVGQELTRPRAPETTIARGANPVWEKPAFVGLLFATALLYLWNLAASGWANSFYSAAVQAGTRSWEAFFFGSSDSSNFITVDKPPVSLWVMELSARVFGLSSWSILVPEAVAGVASVAVLYLTVRRWFSPAAALIAGAVLALTPVATLMFRFNNPDALLVLLLTCAAYATVRAIEHGHTGWLVLAAALVGTGFLTKMLQAFLVVPVFALVFLVAAPTPLGGADPLAPVGRAGAGGRVGLVGCDRRPHAQRRSAVRGRFAGQQHPQPDLWLQRLWAVDRERVGECRRRGQRRRALGRDRLGSPVWKRHGRPDLVADPRRGDRARRRPLDAAAGAAHRPYPRDASDLRRLARPHRRRVQLRRGHHPPVLHRGPGPRDRRAGRDRCHDAVAAPRGRACEADAGSGQRRHSGLGVRVA